MSSGNTGQQNMSDLKGVGKIGSGGDGHDDVGAAETPTENELHRQRHRENMARVRQLKSTRHKQRSKSIDSTRKKKGLQQMSEGDAEILKAKHREGKKGRVEKMSEAEKIIHSAKNRESTHRCRDSTPDEKREANRAADRVREQAELIGVATKNQDDVEVGDNTDRDNCKMGGDIIAEASNAVVGGGGAGVGGDGENIVNDNVFNGQICGDCMVDGSNAMGGVLSIL